MSRTLPSMRILFPLFIAVILIVGSASGQTASYRTFGSGCRPFQYSMELTALNTPRIGTTFRIRTTASWQISIDFGNTYLTTGASKTSWGPIRLPFDMNRLGVWGYSWKCELLTSPDFVSLVPRFARYATYVTKIAIPNSPSLLGVRFYQQLHTHHPQIGLRDWDHVWSSHGGAGVIGT